MVSRVQFRVVRKKRTRFPVSATGGGGGTTVNAPAQIISIRQPSGGSNVFLPTSPVNGKLYIVKDTLGQAGSAAFTIKTQDGTLIDGGASVSISTNFGCKWLTFDGVSWLVLNP